MSEYLHNKEKTDETLRYHQEDLEPGGVGGLGDGSVTPEAQIRAFADSLQAQYFASGCTRATKATSTQKATS